MIPELGHYALILALCFAAAQSTIPLIASYQQQTAWMQAARSLAYGQCFFISLSFLALAYAFIANDFSVTYIANNSNSQLPWIYRLCAIWGAHEGSLLLWVFLLSLWTVAVALLSHHLPLEIMARVLSVLGCVSVGFLLFLLLTSNPFLRLLPQPPQEGLDLNPLLQDPGLVSHPPMLYMGYVGFSVVFAFAIASLLTRDLDKRWAYWCRPWTLIAWCFLTFGIVLGSWWAYRELGWGGWWFWDPVENASFLPWLTGTALLHSLIVTSERNAFKSWTILLAILCFSLCLLGTFLVRSGVLISVHAFAVDPSRGVFMLLFLAIVISGSLGLYAWRIAAVHKTAMSFDLMSRESLLLFNNVLLTGAMLTILLGTLYPLVMDILGLQKISVGSPYFNIVFLPFMGCILFFMAIAPFSRWQIADVGRLCKKLWVIFAGAFLAALIFAWFMPIMQWDIVLGLGLALWVLVATLKSAVQRFKQGSMIHIKQWGMILAHLGVAVCAIGITVVSHGDIQKEVTLGMGEETTVANYAFKFLGAKNLTGPNYTGVEAGILVTKNNRFIALLRPQQRVYTVQKMALAKTAIDANIFRDLYVALGEPLDKNTWSLRIYYKPFIRWIWGGGFLIVLGGVLALVPRKPKHFITSI
jgi:cytochrome c-type biogenesis protein CcmF